MNQTLEKASPETLRTAMLALSAGRAILRKVAPYFASILMLMEHNVEEGLGTVAVNVRAQFFYDPVAVAKWTPKQVAGALAHECCHLWQRHPQRCGKRDHELWNDAGDYSINPAVLQLGLELPPNVLMPRDIGMADGLTADEYYVKLLELKKAGKQPKKKGEGVGQGKCGSCANGHDPKHEPDAGARPATEIAAAVRQTSEAVREAAASGKLKGKLPAGWDKFAAISLEPPRVPWRQQLRHVTRNAIAYRPGAVDNRYDAPSRRQGGLGYGSGVPILARLVAPVPNVCILIDASGSMGKRETDVVMRETAGVLREIGARVTVCVCDSAVHGLAKVDGIAKVAAMMKGGGGSDFRPAFDELAKLRPRPEVVLAFTDGYIDVPSAAPAGMNVAWILIGSKQVPAAWGTVVDILAGELS